MKNNVKGHPSNEVLMAKDSGNKDTRAYYLKKLVKEGEVSLKKEKTCSLEETEKYFNKKYGF